MLTLNMDLMRYEGTAQEKCKERIADKTASKQNWHHDWKVSKAYMHNDYCTAQAA